MSKRAVIIFISFNLFAPFILSQVCSVVKHVCDCLPQEICQNNNDCLKGQMCCPDCCGGHRCTESLICAGPNESYISCGTRCPPTCANRKPKPCDYSCNPGCFCNKGYLRNSAGQCVEEKFCEYTLTK